MLTVIRLVKKFPTLLRNPTFVTMFTDAQQWIPVLSYLMLLDITSIPFQI